MPTLLLILHTCSRFLISPLFCPFPSSTLLLTIDLPPISTNGELSRDRTAAARKALERKGARNTSDFRGVTHHLRTGRWEAHIWQDGKQVGEGPQGGPLGWRPSSWMQWGG